LVVVTNQGGARVSRPRCHRRDGGATLSRLISATGCQGSSSSLNIA